MCEGDCDTDKDCDFGLKCFQREKGEDVTGCYGDISDEVWIDYCIADSNYNI